MPKKQRLLLVLAASLAAVLACPFVRADTKETHPLGRYGFAATVEQVRLCLRAFSPGEKERAEMLANIKRLGDDNFDTRVAATEHLTRLPILPVKELHQAAASDDPEVSMRAKWILAARKDDDGQGMLKAAFDTIAQQNLKGMTADVIEATRHIQSETVWSSAADALKATYETDDAQKLKDALQSEQPVLRYIAAEVLAKAPGADAASSLRTLLADPHPRVLLTAARALGDLGDKSCLAAFVTLLDAPQFRIRLEAVQALRWLTGQKFGYSAGDKPDQRAVAVAKWRQWIESKGKQAKLRFPIETTGELPLFNGEDLTGWKMVVAGRVLDEKAAAGMWRVKDGVLSLTGKPHAYLRTERDFRNYRFSFEYRWPEGVTSGDGGVHLLQTGPDAAMPKCLEVQMHSGNAGDFYALGGFRVDPGGMLKTGVRSRLAGSSEKPIGQWNRFDIDVHDGTVLVKVNDVLQNKATGCPKTPSKISFRIEGDPFELRNIQLLPLDE